MNSIGFKVSISEVAFVVCKYDNHSEAWGKGEEKDLIDLLTFAMKESDDIKRIVVKALAATMNAKSINQPKNEGKKDNA